VILLAVLSGGGSLLPDPRTGRLLGSCLAAVDRGGVAPDEEDSRPRRAFCDAARMIPPPDTRLWKNRLSLTKNRAQDGQEAGRIPLMQKYLELTRGRSHRPGKRRANGRFVPTFGLEIARNDPRSMGALATATIGLVSPRDRRLDPSAELVPRPAAGGPAQSRRGVGPRRGPNGTRTGEMSLSSDHPLP